MTLDVLIAVAPNGARKTRADHPCVPITAQELAATASGCSAAGAAMIHLHVRDDEGRHSLDAGRYREAIVAVRSSAGADMIVQITTEAAGVFGVAEQMAVVEAVQPEACSVALRELCPKDDGPSLSRYRGFIRDCLAQGVWLQHILYDVADVKRFTQLRRDGLYGARPMALLVIGRYQTAESADPATLARMAAELMVDGPDSASWMVCAFGEAETRLLLAASALGGHMRVGFENNLLRADGSIAASNAQRVEDCASGLKRIGLSPMSGKAARELWFRR